jgi:cyclic pyranopterin monophosphate synthase
MKNKFSHIDSSGNPKMVDVSEKRITLRTAKSVATINLGAKIVEQMNGNELITKKGPVFQTAIIAGVMAAKRTHELIPFCHPIGLEDCQIKVDVKKHKAIIECTTRVTGKTGVEMEALTGCTVAALTVYDMCKALSHAMVIEEVKLLGKTGGKKDYKRKR